MTLRSKEQLRTALDLADMTLIGLLAVVVGVSVAFC